MTDVPSPDQGAAPSKKTTDSRRQRYILRVAIGYAVFAALWIFFSDRLLASLLDVAAIVWLSTVKGLFFVTVTTLLLCLALRGVPDETTPQGKMPWVESILISAPGRRIWLYLFAVAASIAMLLVRFGIVVSFEGRPLLILFMFPIILSALAGGIGPGLTATLTVSLGAAYCFSPGYSFLVAQTHDIFQWGFLVVNGVLVSVLAEILHRSRRQIEVSRQFQAVTLESIGDAVLTTDTGGKITFLNAEAEHLTGWSCGEAMGMPLATVFRLIGEQNRQPQEDPVHTVLASGEAVEPANHALLIRRDGRELPVTDTASPIRRGDGSLLGVALIFRDDTKRRQGEHALRESERRFRDIAGISADWIWEVDSEGRFIYASETVWKLLGYRAEEIIGKTPFDLMPPEEAARVRVDFLAIVAKARPFRDLYNVNLHRDGSLRHVLSNGVPVLDGQGNLLGYRGVDRDVTVTMQADREKELTAEVLGLINTAADQRMLLSSLLACLKRWSGCEAVGIRLAAGEDFPYFQTNGFSDDFVRLENSLCSRDVNGGIVRDPEGNPLLECMCGNILQGRVDPGKAFFTNGGSFWSNCTTELLATTTEDDRQGRTRNRCNGVGYESVALIPLRTGGKTFGLIQLNDKRPGRFTIEKITLFERLAEHVANFLDKAQLGEKLKENETQLRAIGDNLPGYIYEYTHDPDGTPRFLHVSAGVSLLHGVSPEEVLRDASALHDQIDPSQRAALVEAEKESAATLTDFAMDLHMHHRDGQWRWVHASSRPRRTFDGSVIWDGAVTDITTRREAEATLRKLSAAVEQTPAVVMITDLAGTIEYVNPAFARITGYSAEEALGKNPSILRSGETPDEVYRELWQTITAGREWRGILHNRRKDGSFFWERVVISPLRDAAGVMSHFIAVKEDITEQKNLEDQFHQAQKMEFVGRLAGGVAHDFNNMLMVISAYTDLALAQTPEDDARHAFLHEVRDAAKRSANLTRQLLAFARKQTVTPVALDVNETVEGMLKMLRRLIGEDIELSWQPGNALWKVLIDPSQIDQLLANLAVNARDAIAGVGRLIIETVNASLDEQACAGHLGCVPGEYVIIGVRDTGVGMSREVREHIFEPFFTTKEEGKGTGLGLATVYGIVKQNNGYISVESEPGQGTVFRIYLPRFVEDAAMEKAQEWETRPLPRGTETVLFVEDETAILGLGKRLLDGLGYKVLAAGSPEEALRLAADFGETIHLLITDIVMPTMNGRDLAAQLKQARPEMQCLFISGYSADIIGKHGVLDEGIHFLQKPFSLREIADKARQVLG